MQQLKSFVLLCLAVLSLVACVAVLLSDDTRAAGSKSRALLAMVPTPNVSFGLENMNDYTGFMAPDDDFIDASTLAPTLELRQAVDAAGSVSEHAEALRALAFRLESEGQLNSSLVELKSAAAKAGAAGLSQLRGNLQTDIGSVLLKNGDLIGAQQALDSAEDSEETWLLLGEIAKARGKYAESSHLLHKALAGFEARGDRGGEGRAHAAECDLLQLQRFTDQAAAACDRALKLQPVGSPYRPYTEKTLGLVHYFSMNLQKAVTLHSQAMKSYRAQGREADALWMREFIIDDQAALLELVSPAEQTEVMKRVYDPLVFEMNKLADRLEASKEVVWWRLSDARLRQADLLRKQGRFAEAKTIWMKAKQAFENRPRGFENVPDYATLYEFEALLAKDMGDLQGARAAFTRCRKILEKVVGPDNIDVLFLDEEIAGVGQEVEA